MQLGFYYPKRDSTFAELFYDTVWACLLNQDSVCLVQGPKYFITYLQGVNKKEQSRLPKVKRVNIRPRENDLIDLVPDNTIN